MLTSALNVPALLSQTVPPVLLGLLLIQLPTFVHVQLDFMKSVELVKPVQPNVMDVQLVMFAMHVQTLSIEDLKITVPVMPDSLMMELQPAKLATQFVKHAVQLTLVLTASLKTTEP